MLHRWLCRRWRTLTIIGLGEVDRNSTADEYLDENEGGLRSNGCQNGQHTRSMTPKTGPVTDIPWVVRINDIVRGMVGLNVVG